MQVEIKKTVTGKYVVKYNCPHCDERLSSPLVDVSLEDTCPSCGNSYEVPGQTEKEQLAQKQQASREATASRKLRDQEQWAQEWAQKSLKAEEEKPSMTAAENARQAEKDLIDEVRGDDSPDEFPIHRLHRKERVIQSNFIAVNIVLLPVLLLLMSIILVEADTVMQEIAALLIAVLCGIIWGTLVLSVAGYHMVVAQVDATKESRRTRAMIQYYLAYQRDTDDPVSWK